MVTFLGYSFTNVMSCILYNVIRGRRVILMIHLAIFDITLILAEEYWVFTENLHIEFHSVLGKIE